MRRIYSTKLLKLALSICIASAISGCGNNKPLERTGKTIVFVGDSYFEGKFDRGKQTIPDGVADITGNKIINLSISGQTLGNENTCTNRAFFKVNTLPKFDSTYSKLIIALSTNDIGMNCADSSFTPGKFKLRLNEVLDSANQVYGVPFKDVILLTPFMTNKDGRDTYMKSDGKCGVFVGAGPDRVAAYRYAIIEVAKEKGCEVLDIWEKENNSGNADKLLGSDGLHCTTKEGSRFIISEISKNIK